MKKVHRAKPAEAYALVLQTLRNSVDKFWGVSELSRFLAFEEDLVRDCLSRAAKLGKAKQAGQVYRGIAEDNKPMVSQPSQKVSHRNKYKEMLAVMTKYSSKQFGSKQFSELLNISRAQAAALLRAGCAKGDIILRESSAGKKHWYQITTQPNRTKTEAAIEPETEEVKAIQREDQSSLWDPWKEAALDGAPTNEIENKAGATNPEESDRKKLPHTVRNGNGSISEEYYEGMLAEVKSLFHEMDSIPESQIRKFFKSLPSKTIEAFLARALLEGVLKFDSTDWSYRLGVHEPKPRI